jgi:hypothetical protein
MNQHERIEALKKAALKSIAAGANNPNQSGVALVTVGPHDALALIEAWEAKVSISEVIKQP